MSNNVINFKDKQHLAKHAQKEAGFDKIKARFESSVPIKKSSKDKLLDIFKKKKNTRTPKKK
jgi:hypothetical protein